MKSAGTKDGRALSHLRVLDLSRVLAGPWATQMLADLGAEVIKVERPGAGDDTRAWGPVFLKNPDGSDTCHTSYFLSANRGKKSVTVDISSPRGQEVVRALASHCDVFVENYKVGTMARYGLSYADLSAINPRLIYCSLTGFGQTGPYATLPGYDFVFQGMGGLMSVTGMPETAHGGGPVKVGIAIGDLMAGMYATVAIQAAIEHRHGSQRGQHIDLALLDCMVATMSHQAMSYLLSGKVPAALGNAHPNMVPYEVFDCKDGKLILAVGNDSQFASFCRAVGHPALCDDPRFAKIAGRVSNRRLLVPIVAALLAERTVQEAIDMLAPVNVPCGPINTLKQVFEDPQVIDRAIRTSIPHASGMEVPNVGNPIRLSETPVSYDHAAPLLGQDTDDVLSRIAGLGPEAISSLRADGVV